MLGTMMISQAADSLLQSQTLAQASLMLPSCTLTPSVNPSFLLPASDALATGAVQSVDLFGSLSRLATAPSLPSETALYLTANPLFQSTVLLLAIAYVLLLRNHLPDIYTLFTHSPGDHAGQRMFENRGSVYLRFLTTTTIIGVLFLIVLGIKYADLLCPESLLEQLSPRLSLLLSPLLGAGILLVISTQIILLRMVGMITRSQEFITDLLFLRKTHFTMAVILITPILLLLSLCPPGIGHIWAYIIVFMLITIILLFLRTTLILFLSKKISISHWFLYLCSVEIFPISFLWLLAVRS